MAATSRGLAATDATNRAANKPAVIGANVVEVGTIANIVTNKTGTIAAGDLSAAGADRKYLIDRLRHTAWIGNSTGTDWYICVDRGASPTQYFDCVYFDQPTFPAGTTVTVKGDDATTPAVPYTGASTIFNAVAVVGGTAGSANQVLVFDAANEWNPRYLQINLHNAAPFTPQLGQLWLGHTVQFPVKSDYGSQSPQAETGNSIRVEGGNGIVLDFGTRGALAARQQTFTIGDVPTGTFLLALKDWFDVALGGGLKAFLYVEDPTAAPNSAVFAKIKAPIKPFDAMQTGPYTSTWKLEYQQQGGV